MLTDGVHIGVYGIKGEVVTGGRWSAGADGLLEGGRHKLASTVCN